MVLDASAAIALAQNPEVQKLGKELGGAALDLGQKGLKELSANPQLQKLGTKAANLGRESLQKLSENPQVAAVAKEAMAKSASPIKNIIEKIRPFVKGIPFVSTILNTILKFLG